MTVTIGPPRYDAVISDLDGVIDTASGGPFPVLLRISGRSVGVTARAALHRPTEITCREQTSTLTPRSSLWFPF